MSSRTRATAQLFYDVGRGYNQEDSQTIVVRETPANFFDRLVFTLPRKKVFNLRFDPAMTEGTFTFRHLVLSGRDREPLNIPPSDLMPFNQIKAKSRQGDDTTFTTVPGANDPGISVILPGPVRAPKRLVPISLRFLVIGDIVFVSLAALCYAARSQLRAAWHSTADRVRKLDSRLQRIAHQFSDTDFIRFDSAALWFYIACVCCFLIGIAFDLNGSSIGMYGSGYKLGTTVAPILGVPRAIRSDEWAYETPAIINQELRSKPFGVSHSSTGDHRTALITNLPVLHFTTFFRPQFWAFFVLPLDYAFATYWEFKALILLTGVFSFLLLITRSSFWSISGALWYFFSPFTQWTYSWPSALPEMTGLICLAAVFGCYITVGKDTRRLFLAVVAFVSCAINFAMCAYVPHLIPLFWLGIISFGAWCAAQRRIILDRKMVTRRTLAIATATILIGVVGFLLYKDLRVVIVATARTIYPGARVYSGGSLTLQTLTSHFFEWTETENHYPKPLGNICEAAGFLWLAPVTLFLMARLKPLGVQRFALGALWIYFVIAFSWLILPFPSHLGSLFALDRAGVTRVLPALGLANVAIVALSMSAYRINQHRIFPLTSLSWVGRALGVCFATFCILCLTNQELGSYFSWTEVSLATIITTILITLMCEGRKSMLAFALIVPQALLFGAVNPMQRGLSVVTRSPLYLFVQAHQELLNGKWFIYSGNGEVVSGYLTMAGCDVYTGVKFLPDVDHFGLFVASGLPLQALNRDALVTAQPVPANIRPSVEVPVPSELVWKVSPTDPVLQGIGIKYFAFDQEPSEAIAASLVPLVKQPISGVWLYKLK